VSLAGCESVRLEVDASSFVTAPVLVRGGGGVGGGGGHLLVRFDDVLLSGASLRGSSLDITLGPGHNTVAFRSVTRFINQSIMAVYSDDLYGHVSCRKFSCSLSFFTVF